MLTVKPKENCMFDEISPGEVMLRLDPGEGRIRNSRAFHIFNIVNTAKTAPIST
ncbi:MAG: hypothetical protein FWG94_08015 [Oscillospiraceae bacterium]|nr:hypothetical protein [Oscillospiraceae bacterium]